MNNSWRHSTVVASTLLIQLCPEFDPPYLQEIIHKKKLSLLLRLIKASRKDGNGLKMLIELIYYFYYIISFKLVLQI